MVSRVLGVKKIVTSPCGLRPTRVVQLMLNLNILGNISPADYDTCIKKNNVSDILTFVNAGHRYGQSCKCDTIK